MIEKQARDLIIETLEKPFERSRFDNLIREMLNEPEPIDKTYSGAYIKDKFDEYISKYERIAKYELGGKRIDVLAVYLKKTTSLERARTMQRNFVAGYLAGNYGSDNYKDAALVAFVSPETNDWRFSLVKLDIGFDKEKLKFHEKFTPARRWSFLVGENEGSHTAQSQLYPIILDDRNNPSLDDIEHAFDIEIVTKEFFQKYRGLFMRTKEELDRVLRKNTEVRKEFKDKNIDTVDFAKKLLGQIVFLYFLQKKGWFGVPRDGKWGDGSRKYLRELFEGKHIKFKNYFNDVLEPLFYEAIAIDHSQNDHWNDKFKSRIPFLNGGLFDAIGGYSWVKTDLNLPNELFSNKNITPEGDPGDGILDIFDRYNFTVNEDLPMEKEVAIDPEMLGKIFEKLGAITPDKYDEWAEAVKSGDKRKELQANKKLGVYYTPREIVHYMCQQSLINYLDTELNTATGSYERIGDPKLDMLGNKSKKGQLDIEVEYSGQIVPKEDIELLVQKGELLVEHEGEVARKDKETKTYSYIIPESIRANAARIDRALAEIKICDPAVGSGAFPIGMMHEIVKIRDLLSRYLPEDEERTHYNFKRECIEKSLYGVDIDRGAVEIAKLRFWLSMVVDETDFKNIKPLPNLDYKLVCGNSLLGVKKDVLNEYLFKQLEELKPKFFNETNKTKKDALKAQIDALIEEITDGKKIFDFEVYFSEVFHQKKGFDIVIANPPYVVAKDRKLREIYAESIFGRANLYGLFIHMSIQNLLKKNGCLIYINPRTLLTDSYFKALRNYILKNTKVRIVMNIVNRRDVFGEVLQSVIIDMFQKGQEEKPIIVKNIEKKEDISKSNEITVSDNEFLYGEKEPVFIVGAKAKVYDIFKKIKPLKSFEERGLVFTTGKIQWDLFKDVLSEHQTKNSTRLIWAENIQRYLFAENRIRDLLFINGKLDSILPIENDTIIVQRTTAVEQEWRIFSTIVSPRVFSIPIQSENDTSYLRSIPNNFNLELPLGLLNSRFMDFIFRHINSNTHVSAGELNSLPYPVADKKVEKKIVALVDRILAAKAKDPDADTSALEAEIDVMVYKLYELTYDEVLVVDPEFSMSRGEYEGC